MTIQYCYRSVFVILFVFLPYWTNAQGSIPQSEVQTINQIIKETSVEEELNQPIEELQGQFEQNPFGLPPATNERMMEIYAEVFKPEAMLPAIRESFVEQYNAEHLNTVRDWLKNESTQKVLNQEEEFYTLQGIRQRVVHKYEMEQNPPDEERRQLMKSLAQGVSANETEVELRTMIFRAMVTAFNELSTQQSFSDSQIDTFVSNFRNQMNAEVDQQVTNQLLIKYHDLDDAVLQEYSDFYSTEAGKWLAETTATAVQSALDNATDRFLKAVNDIQ